MSHEKIKRLRASVASCYFKPKPDLDICFEITEQNCREFGIVNNVSIFGIENAKKQGSREYFSVIYKLLNNKGQLVDNPSTEQIHTTSDLKYQELIIAPFLASQAKLLHLPVTRENNEHEYGVEATNLKAINKIVNNHSPEVIDFIGNYTVTDDAQKHGFYRLVPTYEFARDLKYSENTIAKINMRVWHIQSIERDANNAEILYITNSEKTRPKKKKLSAFFALNKEKHSYAFREDQMIDDQLAWNCITQNNCTQYGIGNVLKKLHRDPYNMQDWKYKQNNGLNSLTGNHIGINVPVFYVGTKGSVFSLHTEDEDLASVNVLVYGEPKVWYIIPPHEYTRVINTVNDLFTIDCTNVLRHKSVLVTPAFLSKNKITHSKVIQRVGEMIVVLPRSFHMGYNCGSNLALSVNFMPQYEVESKKQFLKDNIYCSCDKNTKFNNDYSVLSEV